MLSFSADQLQRSLADGLQQADDWAQHLQGAGHRVVRTVGLGLPRAWLRACGLAPVAWQPLSAGGRPGAKAARTDEAWADALHILPAGPLLVRTDDPSGYTLFSIVRERLRTGALSLRPVFGLDLPGGTGEALRVYRHAQLLKLAAWAASIGGHSPDEGALREAVRWERARHDALDRLGALRSGSRPTLSGSGWMTALLAAQVMPVELHVQALEAFGDERSRAERLQGRRVFVAGLEPEAWQEMQAIDRMGGVVVGDDLAGPPQQTWASGAELWVQASCGPFSDHAADPRERAAYTVRHALSVGAERVLHLARPGDERALWLRPWLRSACQQAGLEFSASGDEDGTAVSTTAPATSARAASPRAQAPAGESRSRKSLAAVAEFSRYQRDWFQTIRQRAASGEPFAVVNADAPQELLRAFDLPFVVNQWWGSIVAAKQQSARYLGLLAERGFPTDAEPYSAQGLAALFDTDAEQAPWGGLPPPRLLLAVKGTPATAGIFASWAEHSGAELLLFDRSAETRLQPPLDWWAQLPSHWDRCLEADRLDLLQSQFAQAIERIAAVTGRRFDEARFAEVMALVNDQEAHYLQTRDLIAQAPRAPVSIVDTMPAVMVPQWHRGTAWGVQAARTLHDEVRQRVEAGQAACDDERLRLMWVGRGLWSHMGFYQRWEASHGAVFVWSMYLGLAADGYLRHCSAGQSLLRALASRFVTMGDELRMPTWAGAWHVKEARLHRVHAAVAVDDADPLVLAALEAAGIPVLRLQLANFGALDHALEEAASRVSRFLDHIDAERVA